MTNKKMIEKYNLAVGHRWNPGSKSPEKGIRYSGKPSKEEIEYIKAHKIEIIAELEAEEQRKVDEVKAAKEAKINAIKTGETIIKVYYRDGEYLSGFTLHGEEAELLVELKLAKYVDSWGYHVESDLVKALSKEFTYEQAAEFARPKLEALAKVKAEKEAKAAAELHNAMENELFIFGDEYLSSVGNRLLHSLGAKMSQKDNRIMIYTTTYSKMIPNANGTYHIREELKAAGFKWDKEEEEWVSEYGEEMAKKTIELLKTYDTKADPYSLGLARCWECGRWCKPSQLDENGYCGC